MGEKTKGVQIAIHCDYANKVQMKECERALKRVQSSLELDEIFQCDPLYKESRRLKMICEGTAKEPHSRRPGPDDDFPDIPGVSTP